MKFSYIVIFMSIFFLPLQVDTANASPRAGIVATVNGAMISQLDLEKAINKELYVRQINKNSPNYNQEKESLRSIVLNALIDEQIFLLEAKKQNITINPEQLDAEIASNIQKSGLSEENFYKELSKSGLTKKAYEQTVRNTLTLQTLIARNVLRKIVIPDEDVLAFYTANGGTMLADVEVALIIYPSVAVATKFGPDLQAGRVDFETTAKSVSVGPNAENGGNFGKMSVSDLAQPVQFQVQKLQQGQVSNIFSLGDQEAQIKLISKGEVGTKPLEVMDDATYQQILNILRQEKVGTRIPEYMQQLKGKAIVSIK